MTPRRGLLVGLIFVVIAIAYWGVQRYAGWPEDWAGVTMLLALGVAMSIMTFVLLAGLRRG
jgi:ABC-type multidrug transport system permease subunit